VSPIPFRVHYTTNMIQSVNSIAKTSAYQLQKTDIRINSICPGLIETGMTGDTFDYARQRGTAGKIGQLNPLGRFGVAEGELWLI
jgi:NAD(P)-dependent dehydrogenase (short-subunit alcohol dehydrogenase family)